MNYKKLLIILLFFLSSSYLLLTEEVTLKNGKNFSGTVLGETDTHIILKTDFGEIKIQKNQIKPETPVVPIVPISKPLTPESKSVQTTIKPDKGKSKKILSSINKTLQIKNLAANKSKVWFDHKRSAAEKGKPKDMHNLGLIYYKGQHIKRNIPLAIKWFKKAAEKGFAESMRYTGYIFEHGIGGYKKNYKKAMKWYKKAAIIGHVESQAYLGRLYETGKASSTDYTTAYIWYKQSADGGSPLAQYYLGCLYYRGAEVPQNYEKAYEWIEKSMNQGYIPSHIKLSEMNFHGKGTRKNIEKAKKLILKAYSKNTDRNLNDEITKLSLKIDQEIKKRSTYDKR
ncbi:sel1 repeat family protein [bacterium]|nr:sel1 repeat family protein [bacterium]